MKQFIAKCLYFVLPVLVLSYPADKVISYFLRQSNQYQGEFEVMNDIYGGQANCDVAIYGSSRAWVQFDPQIVGDSLHLKTYNFGIDGHNFWLQYWRHLEFVKHNKKPKKIILSVDIFSLQKTPTLYQPEQFLPYMLWDKRIAEFTGSYIGYDKIDYYLPLVRYYGKTDALKVCFKIILKGGASTKLRQNGFLGVEREWNEDFDKAKQTMQKYEIKVDSGSVVLFDKFMKECKQSGIEVVMVYPPEYIEGQQFVSNRSLIIGIYKEFAQKYGVRFIDYSGDEICLDKNMFYNASHLNKTGATVFSKKLASALKNIH